MELVLAEMNEEDWGDGTLFYRARDEYVAAIQRVFDRTSPAVDRHTSWLRCTEEPWRSLAGVFEL